MHFSGKLALKVGAVGIAAGAILTPVAAAHAVAAPAITVAPSTGVTDGQSVSVSGTGFGASSTVYLVECGGTTGQADCDTSTLATGTTDATGAFSAVSVTVHEGAVGDTTCAAGDTCFISGTTNPTAPDATNSSAGTFTFSSTVSPSVTVTPATVAKSGDSVSASGQNFAATSTVYVVECSAPASQTSCDLSTLATGTTDAAGAFSGVSVTVHNGAVGDGTCNAGDTCYIVATTSTTAPDATNTGVAPFSFATATGPQITVKPDTKVKDGSTVKVTGSGFPKKKSGLYVVECDSATPANPTSDCNIGDGILGTQETNADGTFSVKLKVAEKWSGGACKPNKPCYISAATSTTPDATNSASSTFTFAKGGGSSKPAATKTKAKFSKKKDKIVGKVTAGGKGVKGLKTALVMKAGKKLKKVATAKTGKGGAFSYKKIKKSGKYVVVTKKSKTTKASVSKVIKVKVKK